MHKTFYNKNIDHQYDIQIIQLLGICVWHLQQLVVFMRSIVFQPLTIVMLIQIPGLSGSEDHKRIGFIMLVMQAAVCF